MDAGGWKCILWIDVELVLNGRGIGLNDKKRYEIFNRTDI